MPADGWESAIDRGLLVQAEVDDYHRRQVDEGGRKVWFLLMMLMMVDVVVDVDKMMG